MIELGMHTDNWRTLSGNFQAAVESAVKYRLSHIEFGVIHGQYFVQGLGYDPAVSLQSNPRALKRYLDGNGLKVSQIDGAYPMMGPDGSSLRRAIRPAGDPLRRRDRLPHGRHHRRRVQDRGPAATTRSSASPATTTASASPGPRTTASIINIETHGPYTTNGDFLERLFTHFDSEYLRFNFDTGNTFISGNDPLEYLKRFRKYLPHCHIKDVSRRPGRGRRAARRRASPAARCRSAAA